MASCKVSLLSKPTKFNTMTFWFTCKYRRAFLYPDSLSTKLHKPTSVVPQAMIVVWFLALKWHTLPIPVSLCLGTFLNSLLGHRGAETEYKETYMKYSSGRRPSQQLLVARVSIERHKNITLEWITYSMIQSLYTSEQVLYSYRNLNVRIL